MKRLVLGPALVAVVVIAAACSSGAGSSAPAASAPAVSAPAGSAGDGIVVVAKDLKFSTSSIIAPANEAFEILLDNQDSAPHNIAIKDAAGVVVFKGEVVTSTQVANEVPALAAGAYEFFCEVHPDMKGTLTAE
jgi:spore coat protein A